MKCKSLQKSYLRNWSLVVPVCMNELAMTVAVWQTEFRTASWGARKSLLFKAHYE